MMRENRAAFLTEVKRIEIKPCAMPAPAANEVLLKMAYIGVCGSDAHFYESGERKGKKFDLPFILGHEASAIVEQMGADVTSLKVGDRVVIEPQKTCGECEYCKSGHYNMCSSVIFPSTPPYDGMLREHFAFPASLCHKLPDNVSLLEGALVEPLAVGLSAAERGNVSLGQTVVIVGVGAIGLTTVLACKARGAAKIICVDLFQNRLDCAKAFGATDIINASTQDAVAEVMRLTDGEGAHVVFETAGSWRTAALTPNYLKKCGTIVIVSNINAETPIRFMDLMYKEGEIKTIYRYKNNFKTAIAAISSGAIDVKGMISKVYPFEETDAAFKSSLEDKMTIVKLVIKLFDKE